MVILINIIVFHTYKHDGSQVVVHKLLELSSTVCAIIWYTYILYFKLKYI